MFMVDLAVPRDIEPEVGQLSDVYLYTVDDLRNTIEEGMRSRQEAAKQAEEIIDTEVDHFLAWMRAQGATDTLLDFRAHAERLRDEALNNALRALKNGKPPEDALQSIGQRPDQQTHPHPQHPDSSRRVPTSATT